MAVNKNFVVKNGIEVATDLLVASSDQNKVGIGSTQPTSLLDVGGDFKALGNSTIVGFATIQDSLNVGAGGTVILADVQSGRLGFNTSTPQHNVHISNVGSGSTSLFVDGGNVKFTGDLEATGGTFTSNVTLDSATITGVSTLGSVKISNGQVTATSGVVTYFGDGSNLTGVTATAGGSIGLGAEGTFVGSGVTQININSSSGSAVVASPVQSGIVTATITTGVSIGLAIALGS